MAIFPPPLECFNESTSAIPQNFIFLFGICYSVKLLFAHTPLPKLLFAHSLFPYAQKLNPIHTLPFPFTFFFVITNVRKTNGQNNARQPADPEQIQPKG